MSSIAAFFSSLISTVHADAEQQPEAEVEEEAPEQPVAEQEEEEPEPEDLHPVIREECKESSKCASLAKHFEHCQEKVHAGQGFKHEDCVEELHFQLSLVHMMHCVDDCAAPKLFSKLR
ncbi:hypothetical protein K443DRAFT_431891 [Laccaria amethystina LaAM-08-1]|uniref:Ubiquinol-cytochrome C reductase hinge domain-containing protein n=1 Tax=Laccaria amethystina LaAM-08-1 TaxID=1095629 RepID=A0A0C9XGU6_9AGAR|nr:hypothetical protein K443DRAFT_431891 [Laccaria amethystina LaAM-08-1]